MYLQVSSERFLLHIKLDLTHKCTSAKLCMTVALEEHRHSGSVPHMGISVRVERNYSYESITHTQIPRSQAYC